MFASYHRSGGPKPRSDESVEIDDTGAARARRVVAIGRTGSFAFQLDAAALASLRKAVSGAANTPVELQAPGRPPYETEEVTAGGESFRFHPGQKLPRPLSTLANRLRGIAEEAMEHPVSGIELTFDQPHNAVVLLALGAAPVAVEWTTDHLAYDLFGPGQALLQSGVLPLGLSPGRQVLQTGWRHAIELTSITVAEDQTFQAKLHFSMTFADGRARESQLTLVAGKGWF